MSIAPATIQGDSDYNQIFLESPDSKPAFISDEILRDDYGYIFNNCKKVIRFIEQSINPFYNELDNLLGVSEYDSNGEKGITITKETVEKAKFFLKKICDEKLDEKLGIFPNIKGLIEFEWLKTNSHFVTIFVDSEGLLHWVSIIKGETRKRKDDLAKNIPEDLKGFIRDCI